MNLIRCRGWFHLYTLGLLVLMPLMGFADSPSIKYVARPGDSLDRIARQHISPIYGWKDLAQINALLNPNFLPIGQRVRIPVAWLVAKPASAKLRQFSGEVQIAELNAPWQLAQQGASVFVGGRIKLGRNSSATLRFADDTEVTLLPESELELDVVSIYADGYMSDTRLRLQSGRVEVRANPKNLPQQKLRVVTPAGIAGVRGTQFIVEAQDNQSVVQVTGGLVAVSNAQGEVMLTSGYGSLIKSAQAPLPPTVIPSAPFLKQAPSKISSFPIRFSAAPENSAVSWVVQAGPSLNPGDGDSQMPVISTQIKTSSPSFEMGPLENGNYLLRTWYIDTQGIPSKPTKHVFEVQIPKKLQSGPVSIQPVWLNDNLDLQLSALPLGQRYLLQLTKDVQGKETIWYSFDGVADTVLPKQIQKQANPYYLWIWVY